MVLAAKKPARNLAIESHSIVEWITYSDEKLKDNVKESKTLDKFDRSSILN